MERAVSALRAIAQRSGGFFIGTTAACQGRRTTKGKNILREPLNNTTPTDCQTHPENPHQPIHRPYFLEADRHIGMAVNLIEEGRSNSATGAMKTCGLILDLLASVRTPLRRLGSIEQEAAFVGAASFEFELNEANR
jgi:hypothetical protein